MIEIESLEEFDRAVARTREHRHSMSGWQVQDLDLTGREDALLELDPRGSLFLGCTISDDVADRLRAGGALIFPARARRAVRPVARAALHPGRALRRSRDGYEHTPDARIYAWSRGGPNGPRPAPDLLAKSLHDQLDRRRPRRVHRASVGSSA